MSYQDWFGQWDGVVDHVLDVFDSALDFFGQLDAYSFIGMDCDGNEVIISIEWDGDPDGISAYGIPIRFIDDTDLMWYAIINEGWRL